MKTKPAAKSDILPQAPIVEDDPITRIKNYREGITKEIENIKIKLSKDVSKAAETYKLLKELGEQNIWWSPEFSEAMATLDICPLKGIEEKAPRKKSSAPVVAGEAGSKTRGDIKSTMLELLKVPANHADLKAATEARLGRKIANQYISLTKMVKDGTIKKDANGNYSLA